LDKDWVAGLPKVRPSRWDIEMIEQLPEGYVHETSDIGIVQILPPSLVT
jgi:hypothetical protein